MVQCRAKLHQKIHWIMEVPDLPAQGWKPPWFMAEHSHLEKLSVAKLKPWFVSNTPWWYDLISDWPFQAPWCKLATRRKRSDWTVTKIKLTCKVHLTDYLVVNVDVSSVFWARWEENMKWLWWPCKKSICRSQQNYNILKKYLEFLLQIESHKYGKWRIWKLDLNHKLNI